MSKNNEQSLEEKINQITEWIANSKHLVAFTGAGISTESGIPDFRGPDGVWTRRDKGLPPPKMKKSWSEVEPNRGHLALVELQNMRLLKFLITQNVDGLHLISGIKPELLAELHGNSNLMVCLSCNKKMTYDEAKWDKDRWGSGYRTSPVNEFQPTCPHCKGRIISSVVNFGDPLPEEDYRKSQQHSELADVYLIIGSSLVVYPAADLPELARKNNAKLVLINMGETPYDELVDIKIEEKIGGVITKIISQVKDLLG
ncbi:MAG: hypothetical protein FK732_05860 [Asgard group archaeon]|nr:hypothetical protein [Asgard group archaeon]